jgi:hypothetical protein
LTSRITQARTSEQEGSGSFRFPIASKNRRDRFIIESTLQSLEIRQMATSKKAKKAVDETLAAPAPAQPAPEAPTAAPATKKVKAPAAETKKEPAKAKPEKKQQEAKPEKKAKKSKR